MGWLACKSQRRYKPAGVHKPQRPFHGEAWDVATNGIHDRSTQFRASYQLEKGLDHDC